MAKLRVGVVSPEREIWTGEADMVIAKTVDGEIGIMPNHAPVLGVLVEGGVLRVKRGDEGDLVAAVHGGFISVADNDVSILAEAAELGSEVDVARAKDALQRAQASIEADQEDADARLQAKRAAARLRAAGEEV
ncbi:MULTISPECIES: F0F1 ATP synthase subunit epsilon [Microbispora]|uniref:ATP synthase epsilon chain n=4 Tax=Microbispora TaxID=2005 RepID=A0A544YWY5_9ACTN|nr:MULTISPECIES: F0F1 ATP synthase subunit epsilon [Microbispora]NJP24807.1 F0F1 ATP synthase subunit epsilon [Microbispora sp. CL1-1]KAB8183774.1 F0F1 ATP synthase subunit epsilon [Microbispora catharanthi]MBD3146077.1 F0F1 ATP synthase subunit epsilon [Microbispora camponoti]MBE3013403.1 F0F1 ATP synthase subunit epsilon [Microbispora sitophila]OPG03220.1 ATP synthase F1 subunit epsilon [Microbispora sp. GKU 823]